MKGKLKIKDGKFKCGFCGNTEKRDIYTSRGTKGRVSDMIRCYRCGNLIPHKNQI